MNALKRKMQKTTMVIRDIENLPPKARSHCPMVEQCEEVRVHLLHDLRANRCGCLLVSELLEDIGEEGEKEDGLPLRDTLFGLSGVLQNVARNLEGLEQTIGGMEPAAVDRFVEGSNRQTE